MKRWLVVVLPSLFLECVGAEGPRGARLDIAVAPLGLAGITEACYDLRVTNQPGGLGDTVWTRTGVCSKRYGDGRGALTYVGTCDASSGSDNTVLLTMTSLTAGDDPVAFVNPCSASEPCALEAPCNPNEDTRVAFNLTVMRQAEQGFFDVAVSFEDIYCSAKVDCEGETLFDAEGDRRPTVVVAVACSGGVDADTQLYLGDLALDCEDGLRSLPIAGPPGNVYSASVPAPDPLVQVATYRGQESLSDGEGNPYNKIYYNVAFILDLPLDAACSLVGSATASDGPFVSSFTTPSQTAYPIIRIDLPLTEDGADDYACTRHPLGQDPDDGIWTDYTSLTATATFELRAYRSGAGVAVERRVTLALSPLALALGPGNTHTFVATGGAPPYTFSAVTGGGSFAPGSGVYTAPGGPANVTVRVTDTTGVSVDASVTVSALTIAPTTSLIAPNATQTFTVNGGAGGYSFSVLGIGAVSDGGIYTAPAGTGSATVRVTDQKGNTADAAVVIALPLALSPTSATVGTLATQVFTPTGGVPPYGYSVVTAGGGSFVDGTYTAPATPGVYTIRVTDASLAYAEAIVTVQNLAKIVFITSTSHTGSLEGLSGADAICQARANAVPSLVGKTFKAWLSSTTISAASRLTHSAGPYTLVTGTTIANNWDDLVDGTLLAPINRTEVGAMSSGTGVWTGTTQDGAISTTDAAKTCNGWTSSSGTFGPSAKGESSRSGCGWTHQSALNGGDFCDQSPVAFSPCSNSAALYCFEQ